MPTLDQIDLVIREYYIVNILLFIIGWMTYELYKLSKKPSDLEINSIKENIRKANKLIADKKILWANDKTKQQLIEEKYYSIISNYDRKHKLLQDDYSVLSAKMNVALKKISALEFENKFLKTKVDDLVEELMKRQSYDDIKKPSKFFQESSYPVPMFTNHQGVNS